MHTQDATENDEVKRSQIRNILKRATLDYGHRQLDYEKREYEQTLITLNDRAQAIMQKYRTDASKEATTQHLSYA